MAASNSSSRKATIVLVGGAWHQPAHYGYLTAQLQQRGYTVHVPARPSIGAEAETKYFDDDVRAVQSLLRECIETRGEHVFVVGHSAGGFIAPPSVEGLSVRQRAAEGKVGGVLGLGLMAAFIAPKDSLMFDGLPYDMTGFISVSPKTTMPTDPVQKFYSDLPTDEAQKWVEMLQPAHFGTPPTLTHEGWRDVPVCYLLCTEDQALKLVLQEALVAKAREQGADIRTSSLQSGHSPFLSMPERTADWIERSLRELDA